MVELCNCPMLDCITPLMSWSNTPIGTPRRTPLPTPHGTPLLTPRATPRATPRNTPRATPSPLPSYRPGEFRSPSRGSVFREEDAPPPRRRFVQAPEIFSSFSSKQVTSQLLHQSYIKKQIKLIVQGFTWLEPEMEKAYKIALTQLNLKSVHTKYVQKCSKSCKKSKYQKMHTKMPKPPNTI